MTKVIPKAVDCLIIRVTKMSLSKSSFENEPIEEMHVRRTIKLAEKQHLENLDRAREAAKLSANVKQAFLSTKALDVSDRKKLEKVEKLTRRVRSEAGGSDSEAALERFPQRSGRCPEPAGRFVRADEKRGGKDAAPGCFGCRNRMRKPPA